MTINILLTLFSLSLGSHDKELELYEATISDDKNKLISIAKKNELESIDTSNSIDFLHDELELYYILSSITLEEDSSFEIYSEKLIDTANKIIKTEKNDAIAYAMLSIAYGMKASYYPLKKIYYGPKNLSSSSKSVKLDRYNPTVMLVDGINKLNTPPIWGGNVSLSIKNFEYVIKYYESKNLTEHNWKYLHALVWLGKSFEKLDQKENAEITYRKALSFEPKFIWAINLLKSLNL